MSWNKIRFRVNFDRQPQYRWPGWKFGFNDDDVFGDLFDRFNKTTIYVQDPDAFHKDVSEIAHRSSTKEQFYARLRIRCDEREAEIKSFLYALSYVAVDGHHSFTHEQMHAFARLTNHGSLDCLMAFLSSLLGRNEYGELPSESETAVYVNAQHKGPNFDYNDTVPALDSTEQTASQAHQQARQSDQAGTDKKRRRQETTDGEETGHDTDSQPKIKRQRTNTDADASTVRDHVQNGTKDTETITPTTPLEIQKESTDGQSFTKLAATNGRTGTARPSDPASENTCEPNEEEHTPGDGKEDMPDDGKKDMPGDEKEDMPGNKKKDMPGDGKEDMPGHKRKYMPSDGKEDMPGHKRKYMPSDGKEDMPGHKRKYMSSDEKKHMPVEQKEEAMKRVSGRNGLNGSPNTDRQSALNHGSSAPTVHQKHP
ncbi:hypothetical protein E4U55_003215 [Claviceps digitariae]|nr:hypothetical protein E4U55_003215 [Claviceps digitariae]